MSGGLSRETVGIISVMIGIVIMLLLMIYGFTRCAEKNEEY